MLAKNILVATLGLASIALYSCGGKNNKTTTEAKKNSETKKISTNFVLRTGQNWRISDKIAIEGAVKCHSEKNERNIKISHEDPTLVVIQNEVCNIKINKIIDSNGSVTEWIATTNNELNLVLNDDMSIDFSDKFGEFKNSSNNAEIMYLNGKKEASGALSFFFKDDNKVITPTVANNIIKEIEKNAITKKLLWVGIGNGTNGLGNGYTVEYSYKTHRNLGYKDFSKFDDFKLKIT